MAPPATILVVDDVLATRSGLAKLLRLRGYTALEAANGEEALDLLRSHPEVRLVILDVNMPRGNGVWFRQRQLADSAIAGIPVVVFTGADLPDESLRFEERLRKPISVDALLAAIERFCAK